MLTPPTNFVRSLAQGKRIVHQVSGQGSQLTIRSKVEHPWVFTRDTMVASLVPRPLLVFQVKSQLKVVWGRSYMTLYTY